MRNLNLTFGDYFCQVPLLLHQKQALAWLLWRESQKPQGGILGKSGIMERTNEDNVVLFLLILSTPLGLLPSYYSGEMSSEWQATCSGPSAVGSVRSRLQAGEADSG